MVEDQVIALSSPFFYFKEGEPHISTDSEEERVHIGIESAAMDTLLNTLKIPIKFFNRLSSVDAKLAQDSVNLWLDDMDDIGILVKEDRAVQFVDIRKEFLSYEAVKTLVAMHLGVEENNIFHQFDGDVHVASFPLGISIELWDTTATLSIRIQFSEHFEIVPRVDLAVTFDKTFESVYSTVRGRKLRVAGAGSSQIINQILEFCDLAIEQGQKEFIPALWNASKGEVIFPEEFARGICNELRIAKKVGTFLIEDVKDDQALEFAKKVGAKLYPEVRPEFIDIEMARAIELSLASYITTGRFK